MERDTAMMKALQQTVESSIQKYVNGKIDKNTSMLAETTAVVNNMRQEVTLNHELHKKDMDRIMPIVLAYEEGERRLGDAKKTGKFALALVGVFLTLGSAWLVLKQLWPSI